MKNLLILISIGLIILFIFSCNYAWGFCYDFDNFKFDDVKFQDLDHLNVWLLFNIKYRWDYNDYWKTPEETLRDGTGDCEDFATLFIAIAYYQFGYECQMGCVRKEGNELPNHACVLYDNRVYEPEEGLSYSIWDYKDNIFCALTMWQIEAYMPYWR